MEKYQTTFKEHCNYLATTPLLTRPIEREILHMYLALSPVMVSSILVYEDEGM